MKIHGAQYYTQRHICPENAPTATFFHHKLDEHVLQGLVKVLIKSIGLKVGEDRSY